MGYIQNLIPSNDRNVNVEILPKRTQNSFIPQMGNQFSQNRFNSFRPNMFNGIMNQNRQTYQFRDPTKMGNSLRNGEYSFQQSRMNQNSPVMGGILSNNHLQVTPIMNTALPNDRNQLIDRRQSFQDNMQQIANKKMENVVLNERKPFF